jgi:hypothetical protein
MGAGRVDQTIAVLAGRQHGNITRRQLFDCGLGSTAVRYRVRNGRLHPVFAGVYAVGHRPPSPLARAAAAVLACGDGAVLSHGSAATLWGISPRWSQPLEVTARSNHQRRGMVVHRSRTLAEQDVTHHFGIAVTTPARTVLDMAPRQTDTVLARAVSSARLGGHLRLTDLAGLLDRLPRHPATARL